ncbi:hypothetical protein L211DRAFT_851100 [Terfezia boudieri ATCC MYA-4762]|uniref:Uncharacterized protein n=1 Tax=Terfezia boudieri ATCC MYA-4762 TaxID=1051890 RepID=A0A3N4LG68_9PEZI|nr:hypothetical protein L211DRAFT_851100 [Terfezia boudieri ATCC MYA-4762]
MVANDKNQYISLALNVTWAGQPFDVFQSAHPPLLHFQACSKVHSVTVHFHHSKLPEILRLKDHLKASRLTLACHKLEAASPWGPTWSTRGNPPRVRASMVYYSHPPSPCNDSAAYGFRHESSEWPRGPTNPYCTSAAFSYNYQCSAATGHSDIGQRTCYSGPECGSPFSFT